MEKNNGPLSPDADAADRRFSAVGRRFQLSRARMGRSRTRPWRAADAGADRAAGTPGAGVNARVREPAR